MKRHVRIDTEKLVALIKSEDYKIGEFAEELNISYRTLKRYFDEQRMPYYTYTKAVELLNVQNDLLMQPSPQAREGEEDLKRRDLIQLGIATTLTSDSDIWNRLAQALKQPGRVDTTVIENLEIIKHQCYRLLPDIIGYVSPDLRAYVQRQLETIIALLEGSPPLKYQHRLSGIAAELSIIIGAIDGGLKESEGIAFNIALECAIAAENRVLQALALGRLALQFIHHGQAHMALDSLQKARYYAENSAATPTTRCWLAAIDAEAHANMKQEVLCLRALEVAGKATEHGKKGQDPYWTTFDAALYTGYQGVCYLKLERFQDAQAVLSEALKAPGSPYKRAIFTSDLTGVYIAQGNIDAACKYTHETLELSEQTGSPWFVKRVRHLRSQLDLWSGTEAVQKLDEILRRALL